MASKAGTVEVIRVLKRGGVAVMPSDTILGIMGSAMKPKTVERIYRLRGRDRGKPLIVLISSASDLKKFGVALTPRLAAFLMRNWPGPVSVVLPCPLSKFRYLHRGTGTIAFRVPQPLVLRKFLAKTGPLVAPSANKAEKPPARNAAEAMRIFGGKVDAYMPGISRLGRPKLGVPGRSRSSAPSLVVKVLRY